MKHTSLFILLAFVILVHSWPTGGPFDLPIFHVHKDIALRILDHPTIKPYLAKFNLTRDEIAHIAATEPQYLKKKGFSWHPGWRAISTKNMTNW